MDPLNESELSADALDLVARAAPGYLDALPDRPVSDPASWHRLAELGGPLPEDGEGTLATVGRLIDVGTATATHSLGPRFFHYVTGGATPAAQAGDWLTSLLDQVSGLWAASAFATEAETVALRWLKELFHLPESHGAVLTPSATFANLTGLACARQWWGERHGVDIAAEGLAGLPRMPVLASGYVHVSTRKALQILGCGRDTVQVHARDDAGRIDLAAMDRALSRTQGPAVIVGTAGEVDTGDFDPLADLADLAEAHGAWLHVDGAFGLFAAVTPRLAHLVDGVERADSVASDGHKWLNVPYESGFAFVREREWMRKAFGAWNAAYLRSGDGEERIDYNNLGPESSRRARALPVWATLRAYGRQGYRDMVERHHDLALRLGDLVQRAPDLELLAPVRLCVVCFRYRPPGVDGAELDALNQRLGAELLADGRVLAGTTVHRGMTALRPAIVNWRTGEREIDLLVEVVRTIGARLSG
ncbi:pyridoxal-dependent decarboxylase [Wenjunlia vitaminophila]|uniref:Pyridoxal-dependent decarboxylase n=1 Tax=Wenjunlia vitaminophila TaxID=76728 RepID=A0A0T6LUG4_WENVI|nr:aminotransferase class I/II-fold pyridoxal phosphate-dependent enzyme [Wenjunlia vitaminophila]KRV49795.1 pyridoxal-dependent decarboxylase [Wenjunlia vitaminophila]